MIRVYPLAVFLCSFAVLSIASWVGATRFQRHRARLETIKDEFGIIQGATLTLLGLIIGFTFSMALSRYDQRKDYEEEEANAIGTEYVRAELLPAADAAKVRSLLASYLEQRILFYTTRDEEGLERIGSATAKLQADLWSVVRDQAVAQPTPVNTLVAAGMNDVLNTQGYTQAAWWNRIPFGAWALMMIIAICAATLVGMATSIKAGFSRLLLVLPAVISVAFFMIADIDSPRRGVIRVVPKNLLSLAASIGAPAPGSG